MTNLLSDGRISSLIAARPKLCPYPGWRLGRGESDSGWLTKVRKQFWERSERPFRIRWLRGLYLYIYPKNETSRAIFLTGCYEPNEFLWLESVLKPGNTFVDVGANMGLYTLFAAAMLGPRGVVLAIEPSSRDFARLEAHVRLNNLTTAHLFRVAASDRRGEADLLVATEEKTGHNTLGAFAYASVVLQGREQVPLERLDDIVQKVGLQRVDVIKMDVEGAEYSALQGAVGTLARFHPIILMELSDRTLAQQGGSSSQVWDLLVQNGYLIYVFDEQTGLPSLGVKKLYFDAESIIAIHESLKEKFRVHNSG